MNQTQSWRIHENEKKCNKDHKQQNRSNRRKNISGISEIEDRDCEITQSENNNNKKSKIKPYVIYGRPWKHTHRQIIEIPEGKVREESESLFNE